jgi:predicted ester cyclase
VLAIHRHASWQNLPPKSSAKISGVDPSGNHISYAGVAIFAIGGHQLMSAWVLGDRYELMRQLGAILNPSPRRIA